MKRLRTGAIITMGVVCVILLLVVVRFHSVSDSGSQTGSDFVVIAEEPVESLAIADDVSRERASVRPNKEEVKRNLETLQDLIAEGYAIDAVRVGRRTAEGDVKLLHPDGFEFRCDDCSLSSDGTILVLQGDITMEYDDYQEGVRHKNRSEGPKAIARIHVGADSMIEFPGVWRHLKEPISDQ